MWKLFPRSKPPMPDDESALVWVWRDGWKRARRLTLYTFLQIEDGEGGTLHEETTPAVLFCPACVHQHIDTAEPETGWNNPPHRTHKCEECGHLWLAARINTTGVKEVRQ